MEASEFDEGDFFRAIAERNVRALLIGRRALIALGIPVLTADYDFWVHPDDCLGFNEALARFGLHPGHSPDAARARGRYVLENDEHVDVLAARSVTTVDGVSVSFDDVWSRRQIVQLSGGVTVAIPSLEDLVATKRFASRPKDVEDIRLLETLRRRGSEGK